MKHADQLFTLVGTLIALALLIGCGQDGSNGGGGTSTPLPTATSGSVTLKVDASSYHPGDTITVTLSNGSNQTIYFQDHLTNCTVIQLENQAGGGWQIVNKCLLMSPTGWHSLDAGKSLTVRLVPPSDRQWPTGVSRVTLGYGLNRSIGSLTVVYSTGFQVS